MPFRNQPIAKRLRACQDGIGFLGDLADLPDTISKHSSPLAVDPRCGHAEHPRCFPIDSSDTR